MPAVPVLYLRDTAPSAGGAPAAAAGCFEGIYNPDAVPLNWSGLGTNARSIILCPDPDSTGDLTAFRLDLRDSHGSFEHVLFAVHRTVAGEASMQAHDGPPQRVRLPSSATPFNDHPELLGAMFALGLVPITQGVIHRLER
jgi:hypothetical protein